MDKTWKIKKKVPQSFINQFKDYPPLLLNLLYNRHIRNKDEIEDFLSIDYKKDLHDPYLLSGMKTAVRRIKKAIYNKEQIAIFGDYDADGICASTILNQTFEKLGLNPFVYLPDRKKDGYGLSQKALEELAKKGASLVITVDCGTTDIEEVAFAKKIGLDVIVTDHHLVAKKLPSALVTINPRKKNDTYPNKNLSGAGVAFKLAEALIYAYPKKFNKGAEKWLLDLVAIATVADMMILKGENRTLVKYGLLVLAKTKRVGLKRLLIDAGIKNPRIKWIDKKKNRFIVKNIDAHTIGFIIGPRLNAAGRIDHANTAFFLLNTVSPEEAQKISRKLSRKNQVRQRFQRKITKKITQNISSKDINNKVIIKGDSECPLGIVGLVSGKITDKFYLPSFIYTQENQLIRGSCRSIPEVNIVKMLDKCQRYLNTFGGHKGAGGFSIKKNCIKKFEKCLIQQAHVFLKNKKLQPKLDIDIVLNFSQIKYDLKNILNELAPYGQGNPEPLFAVKKALLIEQRKIGKKGQHLLLRIKKIEDGKDMYLRALLFENVLKSQPLVIGEKYDFAFSLLFDEWQGYKKVTLRIIDWKKV
jgi:single-stranded-DNA-specific exonuclease